MLGFDLMIQKANKGLVAGLLVIVTMSLLSCSSAIDGEKYTEVSPAFHIDRFFDGNVKAWGVVQNRSGNIVQRFVVDIEGRKENGKLILDERFNYGVGNGPLKRVWSLTQQTDGTYAGTASDISGVALGRSFGNGFNFQYEMNLEVDNSTYRVKFDDWFWAFDDNTLMNRSYIKKFGIVMAEVTIFMQKQ